MTTLLNGLWQGTLLTVLAILLLKFLPRLNAATRYAVWWITFVVVAVLPVRPMVIGSVSSDAGSPAVVVSARELVQSPSITLAKLHGAATFASSQKTATSVDSDAGRIILPAPVSETWIPIRLTARPVLGIVAALWAVASGVLLLRLGFSFRSMQRLKSYSCPAPQSLQARLSELAAKAGVCRRARLLVSDEIAAPMALGLFNPVIVIPRSMPEHMSELDFDHVALHELAHLRRYDDWMNLLQKLVEALLPIQPALFWIGRQLTLDRESACDDWVIAAAGTRKQYAASLSRIAELTIRARHEILATGVAGRSSQLYRRVQRLLDKGRNVAPGVSTRPLALATGIVIALACVVLNSPQMVALADSPSTGVAAPQGQVVTQEPATQPAQPGVQVWSFPVQPGDKLVVDVDRGNVHLTGGEQNTVGIVVTQTAPDLAEFLKHHVVTVTQKGHEVRLQANFDDSRDAVAVGNVEYQVTVPTKFDAQLADGAGNVDIDNLHGTLDAETRAGNVLADHCAGRMTATADSGNLGLHEIDGQVEGRTRAGNVDATACHGALNLATDDGNITLKAIDASVDGRTNAGNIDSADCTGALQVNARLGSITIDRFGGPSVAAETGAGNVSVDLAGSVKADSSLITSMGNVELKINAAAAVHLTASSGMGDVHSDFPLGAINGGGPSLRVETKMGNVEISKR